MSPRISKRQNRGKPPNKFSPEGKVRYAIAQYVSTQRLSPKYQVMANQMAGIKIPTKVEEALQDPRWFDVKNAFLHVDLEEKVYMDLPPRYETPNEAGKNHHLTIYQDQVPTNKERYQRLVGRLIYLSLTRPDIVYAISVVSQFMHAPSEDRMAAMMRILSYLKGVLGRGLIFKKHRHMEVKGYIDADWAGNITDRSTSGYFTFVAGNLVTSRSKKQNVVPRSMAEAEYKGMAHEICELLWLKILLTEIGFKPQ
ncbi:secreted RxLR effector protein 161-like [Malus domestica]|uniref:secreted RxLR effector protein 161-like n=1 Tax=Malus domestica TaxID=3750 RepID=UPI003976F851